VGPEIFLKTKVGPSSNKVENHCTSACRSSPNHEVEEVKWEQAQECFRNVELVVLLISIWIFPLPFS